GWTNTGIPVLRGQRISFTARGDIMISPTAASGPNGSPAVTSPNVRYPLQGVPAGALIGRVGNGAPFAIGRNTQPITMPANGPLMLGINDDILNDNSGSYSVGLRRAAGGTRRRSWSDAFSKPLDPRLGDRRHRHGVAEQHFTRVDVHAVQILVVVGVAAQHAAREVDAGKESLRAGVRQDFGRDVGVGGGACVAANRTGGHRTLRTEH